MLLLEVVSLPSGKHFHSLGVICLLQPFLRVIFSNCSWEMPHLVLAHALSQAEGCGNVIVLLKHLPLSAVHPWGASLCQSFMASSQPFSSTVWTSPQPPAVPAVYCGDDTKSREWHSTFSPKCVCFVFGISTGEYRCCSMPVHQVLTCACALITQCTLQATLIPCEMEPKLPLLYALELLSRGIQFFL